MYNNFVTWQLGFTFQAPLGMRSPLANTRQAQYILLRARAYLQQIVHQTTHSLARFFLEIDANYKQFKTASRLRAAAAQRLDAQRAYYEEGRITIDRFLDAVSQYATAVATEAQYKTTYNVSIVRPGRGQGDAARLRQHRRGRGPASAEGLYPGSRYPGCPQQFHILPDGPQVPKPPVGPLNPDPIDEKAPPGVADRSRSLLSLAPLARWDHAPTRCLPTPRPACIPSSRRQAPRRARLTARCQPHSPATDVSLTSGAMPRGPSGGRASLIDPTVPGMGSTSVAASLGRTATTAASPVPARSRRVQPVAGGFAAPATTVAATPSATPCHAAATPPPSAAAAGKPPEPTTFLRCRSRSTCPRYRRIDESSSGIAVKSRHDDFQEGRASRRSRGPFSLHRFHSASDSLTLLANRWICFQLKLSKNC